jgi:glutamyl-tRNA synthetase
VGATAGVFNPDKMAWVNHEWLKQVPEDDLARKALPFFRAAGLPAEDDAKLRHVARVARDRVRTLSEYASAFAYFYGPVTFDPKAKEKLLTKENRPVLEAIRAGIAGLASLETAALEAVFQAEAARRTVGLGKIAQPVRVALVGGTASPGMYDVVQILGKDETLRRLDEGIRLAG